MNAQLKIAGRSPGLLGLESLLVGSLPAALMTEKAPDRYIVEAVFKRKADRDGAVTIPDDDTRARLSANGLPAVELHVAESVGFARPSDPTAAADDDSGIEDWVEEGGAVRA